MSGSTSGKRSTTAKTKNAHDTSRLSAKSSASSSSNKMSQNRGYHVNASMDASTVVPPASPFLAGSEENELSSIFADLSSDNEDLPPGPGHYNPNYELTSRTRSTRGGAIGKAKCGRIFGDIDCEVEVVVEQKGSFFSCCKKDLVTSKNKKDQHQSNRDELLRRETAAMMSEQTQIRIRN
ncbi:unnamed protein product, partial [Amoebophrya sp. A25]|eukprot:GSA25T00017302001.1